MSRRGAGTQITCFTGTKVQILTQLVEEQLALSILQQRRVAVAKWQFDVHDGARWHEAPPMQQACSLLHAWVTFASASYVASETEAPALHQHKFDLHECVT